MLVAVFGICSFILFPLFFCFRVVFPNDPNTVYIYIHIQTMLFEDMVLVCFSGEIPWKFIGIVCPALILQRPSDLWKRALAFAPHWLGLRSMMMVNSVGDLSRSALLSSWMIR